MVTKWAPTTQTLSADWILAIVVGLRLASNTASCRSTPARIGEVSLGICRRDDGICYFFWSFLNSPRNGVQMLSCSNHTPPAAKTLALHLPTYLLSQQASAEGCDQGYWGYYGGHGALFVFGSLFPNYEVWWSAAARSNSVPFT
jgi:hypothetical protein